MAISSSTFHPTNKALALDDALGSLLRGAIDLLGQGAAIAMEYGPGGGVKQIANFQRD